MPKEKGYFDGGKVVLNMSSLFVYSLSVFLLFLVWIFVIKSRKSLYIVSNAAHQEVSPAAFRD